MSKLFSIPSLFVTNTLGQSLALDPATIVSINVEQPTGISVPEPSSNLTLIAFGVLGVALTIKYQSRVN
ncbi:hypothetical protein cce_2126 [Crocosphaera subtropica ATCC 51142]|uniref:Ice-binding protein C-terminal domain-containing protein n=1 Tax=Crocosphaera subtropica (strain ATCC 51142 / BH68) TaxID=43989 RepID=B1WNP7_CROS5|nr:PEP-CTERM sorting domain-containing protein [Crocosphaera subtropica]ACB51476.1 hypothetical protein cce_2126 [Crocosphaera subtropica ATCC 51142]